MPSFDVTIEGLDALKRQLQNMKPLVAKRIANRALRAGAAVFQREIVHHAPHRPDLPSSTALPPGALENDIEIVTLPAPDQLSSYVAVGPGKYTRHVARLLEFGHDLVRNPSVAIGTRGKGRGRLGSGGEVVGHVSAHPFMRPSFETGLSAATDAIAASIRQDMSKINNGQLSTVREDEGEE